MSAGRHDPLGDPIAPRLPLDVVCSSRLRPRRLLFAFALAFGGGALAALFAWLGYQLWLRTQILDSGGELSPLQAAYDVRRYDLEIALAPERRALRGRAKATVEALASLTSFEIQLDERFRVAAVAVDSQPARFEHDDGLIRIPLEQPWQRSERHTVVIDYAGRPKVAIEPPWFDGFVWATSAAGAPWIAVVVQGDGADDWWPAKDHPSDEPDDGLSLALTVPGGLVGLSNGRQVALRTNPDGSVTTLWESRYPINNYLVTVNVGPYVAVEERYRGVDGTLDLPMTFWALPEHVDSARRLWRDAPTIVTLLARRFGEFPFLADKIAAVEAPFAGMEHQTLVAYGDDFEPDDFGFDETLVHELAHEWWGNKISARDWDDFWIHEGFATYAEVLYVEAMQGPARARDYLEGLRAEIDNQAPLVAGRPRTSAEAYSQDLYSKGAWVLASLRWAIGDNAFFAIVRRFADQPQGACRLVDSAELARIVTEESGLALDGFWERYLRRAELPRYRVERQPSGVPGRDQIVLTWDDPSFALPLPVRVGGELRRIDLPRGRAAFTVAAGEAVVVEREGRILAEPF